MCLAMMTTTKMSENPVPKQKENEDGQRSVTSPPQEEGKELLLPELPFSFTENIGMKNEATQCSAHDKEEEKDIYDDENNETDVEETDDEDDVCVHDYSKNSQGSGISYAPYEILKCIDARLARIEARPHTELEMLQQMKNMMQQMQTELGRQQEIQLQVCDHLLHMITKQPSLETDISKLQDNLVSRLEHSLAQHMQQETQRLQESLKASDAQRKRWEEFLRWNMMDGESRSVNDTVSYVLRPGMTQALFPDQQYMRQNMDHTLRERLATESVVGRMEAAMQKFLQDVDQMKTLVINNVKEELSGQMAQVVVGIKENMLSNLRKIMKEELASVMKEHGATISDRLTANLGSGAATPVLLTSEEEHSKERIAQALYLGRINEAFKYALSTWNHDLVVYTCEAADPYNIFAKSPSPLTQPVLLLLISQLTAKLDTSFDLKMKVLEGAVLNLDISQSVTADHIPNVLGGLIHNLQAAEAHRFNTRKSLLIMAANFLLK